MPAMSTSSVERKIGKSGEDRFEHRVQSYTKPEASPRRSATATEPPPPTVRSAGEISTLKRSHQMITLG